MQPCPCPGEEALLGLLSGALSREDTRSVEAHLDRCDSCRALVAAIGQDGGLSVAASLAPPAPADLEERYRVVGELGRGGQARVLVAFDRVIGREVAIKRQLPDPARADGGVGAPSDARRARVAAQRLLREARITGQLSHPGVVPVYDICEQPDGELYYTMELVRGETLADRLARCATIGERLALLPHVLAFCQAIAFAHSRGILHRDIKPQNVMIGDFGETVILDWGLATSFTGRPADSPAGAPSPGGATLGVSGELVTLEHTAIGTPAYMSPEQAAGDHGAIDERTDVFGLGAVLHHLLSGRPPRSHTRGSPRDAAIAPTLAHAPDAPPELAAIADKALAARPADRYQAVTALARDLNAFMTGGRVSCYSYGRLERTRRFVAKHRALATSAMLVFATLVTALGLVAASLRSERHARVEVAQARALAETRQVEAELEAARSALGRDDLLQARGRTRAALERRDTTTGRILAHQIAHARELWAAHPCPMLDGIAATQDGSTIAAGCGASVALLDSRTGAPQSLRGLRGSVLDAAFSPDASRLLVGTMSGAALFDLHTAKLAHQVDLGGAVHGVAIAPDGVLAAFSDHDAAVHLWDVAAWRELALLSGHKETTTGLAFTPDGAHLASASYDGTVRIWNVAKRSVELELRGHEGWVLGVAISPDGRSLASAGDDGMVLLFDLPSGALRARLAGHGDMVYALAFNRSGSLLASAGKDRTVRLWSIADGRLVDSFVAADTKIMALAFPSDEQLVIGTQSGWVRALRTARVEPLAAAEPLSVYYESLAASPDGRLIAAGGHDGDVAVWDLASSTPKERLRGHTGGVLVVAFANNGRLLASGGTDHTVRLWDLDDGSQATLEAHATTVFSLAFSPDGRLLASGDKHGLLQLWDVETRRALRARTFPGPVNHLDMAPDGRTLLIATDEDLLLCTASTLSDCRSLKGHPGALYVDFDRPGATLYSSYGRSVRRFNVRTGGDSTVVWDAGSATIRHLSVSGDLLAVALDTEDPSGEISPAHILDLASGAATAPRAFRSGATAVAVVPQRSLVATANNDGTVRVWHVPGGRHVWRTVGLWRTPEVVLTHAGWEDLVTGAAAGAPLGTLRWQRYLEEQAIVAAQAPDGQHTCILGEAAATNDGVELLWVAQGDDEALARLSDLPLTMREVGQLAAADSGCLVVADGAVTLLDESGGRPLDTGLDGAPRTVAVSDGTILVTLDREVRLYDLTGTLVGVDVVDADATTAALIRGRLAVGFADGSVEWSDHDARGRGARLHLEDAPSRSVSRLAAGPKDTLAAGYDDGTVALWSLETGVRLLGTAMHGPVAHLEVSGQRLLAATDLGAHVSWDLTPLTGDYCALLRNVWRETPIIWEGGVAVARSPDPDHPCNKP